MRRRIALTCASAREGRVQLKGLAAAGFELVERFDLDAVKDSRTLINELAGVWGTIAGSERYSRDVLESLETLRVIVRCGVGYDAIDVEAATERGIAIVTTPGANSGAVADFTLALMLACLRRLIPADRSLRSGGWRQPGLGFDLAGATVGVVGLGTIGRAVARRLSGFGCEILAVEPFPDRELCRALDIKVLPLDEVLVEVDVLTIHTPLLPETRNLIGRRELARMKSTAVIVNTARGGVVEEDALVAALEAGQIGGAALDVFEHEPVGPNHPLAGRDDVVVAPHAASFSYGSVRQTLTMVMAALVEVAGGRVPRGCVNPQYAEHRANRGELDSIGTRPSGNTF